MRRALIILTAVLALLPVAAAHAARSAKKAIVGPVELDGTSAFPIYHDLGAGIYMGTLDWARIAAFKPARARDPEDPSYDWPQDLDEAMSDAKANHMQIALTITGAPRWANGGHPARYAPKRAADFADFAVAAARRYPSVHLWIAWQDASTAPGFTAKRYAKVLDRTYGALKSVSERNMLAGGGSTAANAAGWIKGLVLPGGRAPRLDYYAHDPSSTHRLTAKGLTILEKRVHKRFHAEKKLFLDGYTLPTIGAHRVSPATQASYLKTAFQLANAPFIYALAYDGLSDEGHADGRGLLEADGTRRPAYRAFKNTR